MPTPNGPQFQMTQYGQGMTVAPPPVEYEDEEPKVATAGNEKNPPDDDNSDLKYSKYLKNNFK